eukprot:5732842-Pleurochrysis_carterae.AAC.1
MHSHASLCMPAYTGASIDWRVQPFTHTRAHAPRRMTCNDGHHTRLHALGEMEATELIRTFREAHACSHARAHARTHADVHARTHAD